VRRLVSRSFVRRVELGRIEERVLVSRGDMQ
jgi:hypothetical protein